MSLIVDHVGFVAAEVEGLAAAFSTLGFVVAPAGELCSYSEGEVVPLGQTSRHVLFSEGYIELTQVRATSEEHHLGARGHRDGLHIVVLGAASADDAAARLSADGVPVGAMTESARQVAYPDRAGLARFRWFGLEPEAAPEAYVGVVEHQTPDLVLAPLPAGHANGASRLAEVILEVSDLDEAATRWQSILGAEVTEHHEHARVIRPEDSPALRLVDGVWRSLAYPGVDPGPLPAAIAVRIDSSLTGEEIESALEVEPGGRSSDGLWFAPDDAGGAVIEFVASTYCGGPDV